MTFKLAKELLDGLEAPNVLADLGYLSKALKEDFESRHVTLWTPLLANMRGVKEHNKRENS